MTPLHWAAQMGHMEVAKALMDEGAPTEAKDLVSRPVPQFQPQLRPISSVFRAL